jgi:hypothetical protein
MTKIARGLTVFGVAAGIALSAVVPASAALLDPVTCQAGETHTYVEVANTEVLDACIG